MILSTAVTCSFEFVSECNHLNAGFPRLLEALCPGKSWKNILENYTFLLVLMENKQK